MDAVFQNFQVALSLFSHALCKTKSIHDKAAVSFFQDPDCVLLFFIGIKIR